MGLFEPSRIMRPNQLRDSDNASSTTLLFARRIYVFSPSENPNGIPSQCPGLRGTSYPGSSAKKPPQPQRGCDPCAPARAPGAFASTFSQGSSFLATLGWRSQSLWDCSRPNAIRPHQANSFESGFCHSNSNSRFDPAFVAAAAV